ncbi:MAG TPA: amidohydrolase family protein [Vicinamibacterales bacterium]|nr:amidohydrolase family protein [Vicinamibacterales bacterium]
MSSRVLVVAAAIALAAAAGVAQAPQGQQSEGALRPRPGAGRQPEFPIPNIREYKPRSTLVVPEHHVPRAKYPVIDIHSHQPAPISDDELDRVVAAMDGLNLQVLVNVSGVSGERLKQAIAALRASRHRNRMVQFTTIDFRNVGPGWGARAAAQLEQDVKAGAVGVGEISKAFGLQIRKADGTRLRIDDPELDPVWEAAARLKVPVLIHTADPQEFFQPIDYRNERWLELALFPDRRFPSPPYPSFEELMAERDRLFRKHRNTIFIAAHMGWHANDLARLGRMFDEMPNVYGEVGAVLYDLGRQPRTAHAFFVKYQDRILFGKDSFQPDEFPYFWRTFETADEYFDYYRDYHAFWKLYGLALPDDVLRKLYYANALKLVPGIPRDRFPR